MIVIVWFCWKGSAQCERWVRLSQLCVHMCVSNLVCRFPDQDWSLVGESSIHILTASKNHYHTAVTQVQLLVPLQVQQLPPGQVGVDLVGGPVLQHHQLRHVKKLLHKSLLSFQPKTHMVLRDHGATQERKHNKTHSVKSVKSARKTQERQNNRTRSRLVDE